MSNNNQRNHNNNQNRVGNTSTTGDAVANKPHIDYSRIAGIVAKEPEFEGRKLRPDEIEFALAKLLVSVTGIDAHDIISIRTLIGRDGDTPDVVATIKKKAVTKSNKSSNDGRASWVSGIDTDDGGNGKVSNSFIDPLKNLLINPRDFRQRFTSVKGKDVYELTLDTEMVASVLCDVDFRDQFLKIQELVIENNNNKHDKHNNKRRDKRICGMIIRYSKSRKGFSKDYVSEVINNQ